MYHRDFTPDQLTALQKLIEHYPRGLSIKDAGARAVFDSLVQRDTEIVRLVDYPDAPSHDAYVLSDQYAEALRAETTEAASNAANN